MWTARALKSRAAARTRHATPLRSQTRRVIIEKCSSSTSCEHCSRRRGRESRHDARAMRREERKNRRSRRRRAFCSRSVARFSRVYERRFNWCRVVVPAAAAADDSERPSARQKRRAASSCARARAQFAKVRDTQRSKQRALATSTAAAAASLPERAAHARARERPSKARDTNDAPPLAASAKTPLHINTIKPTRRSPLAAAAADNDEAAVGARSTDKRLTLDSLARARARRLANDGDGRFARASSPRRREPLADCSSDAQVRTWRARAARNSAASRRLRGARVARGHFLCVVGGESWRRSNGSIMFWRSCAALPRGKLDKSALRYARAHGGSALDF